MTREQKAKKYFENDLFEPYVEYNENKKLLYKHWYDDDWRECKYDEHNKIFDYFNYQESFSIYFMNIITCK